MKAIDGYIVSYAQNREDLIIAAYFPDVEKGTYVDVGANDPADDSVTKLFYDKGWSGINIEPNQKLYRKLVAARKNDITLPIGLSDSVGDIEFREYSNHGLSTFSEDTKRFQGEDEPSITFKDYRVKVKTLAGVLKEHLKNRNIHFLKIDVEGYEYEVLNGNDWKKYRPELLCIEANHVNHDWRPLVAKADYELVFNDGLNEYYLRKESMYRKEYFDYAESMILAGTIISPGTARRILNGDNNGRKLERLISEIQSMIAENALLKIELNDARAEKSVRFHSRKLAGAAARSLRRRLKPVLPKTSK